MFNRPTSDFMCIKNIFYKHPSTILDGGTLLLGLSPHLGLGFSG
jgi:hypothetical protein